MIASSDLDFGAVTDYDWALAGGDWSAVVTAANRMHCPAGADDCYREVRAWEGYEALDLLGDRPFVTLLAWEWNDNSPSPDDPDRPQYGHRNIYAFVEGDSEGAYPESEVDCTPGPGCIPLAVSGQGDAPDRDDWQAYYEPCRLWEDLLQASDAWEGLSFLSVPHHPAMAVIPSDIDSARPSPAEHPAVDASDP